MPSFQEDLIRRYLLAEMQAHSLIEVDQGTPYFRGEKNDYWVELKVTPVPRAERLRGD